MNFLAKTVAWLLIATAIGTLLIAFNPANARETDNDTARSLLNILESLADESSADDADALADIEHTLANLPDPSALKARLAELTNATERDLSDAPTLARLLVTCNNDVRFARALVSVTRIGAFALIVAAQSKDTAATLDDDFANIKDAIRALDIAITEAELACRKVHFAENHWN